MPNLGELVTISAMNLRNKSGFDSVIAIDGPSGSGKSTIAKIFAQELNIKYIDSGAMYRTVACVLQNTSLDFSKSSLSHDEEQFVQKILESKKFNYLPKPSVLVEVDHEDYSQKIRENSVSTFASMTSKFSIVRDFVNNWQKQVVKDHFAVIDGRDIGTVLFPNAVIKFFVTASVDVRANRRYHELTLKGNFSGTLESLKEDIANRDYQDANRPIAPLKQAQDAIFIDTSHLQISDVLTKMKDECVKKGILYA